MSCVPWLALSKVAQPWGVDRSLVHSNEPQVDPLLILIHVTICFVHRSFSSCERIIKLGCLFPFRASSVPHCASHFSFHLQYERRIEDVEH